MDWMLIVPVLAGGIRNVAGWLENSLKDGKIESYEWGKLISTILNVGILSFAAMYGLNMDAVSASGVGVISSYIFSALKK